VNCATALCTSRKECNEYDITDAQCLQFAYHNDWSRWFAISSPRPICSLCFSFMGGIAKQQITKLRFRKVFLQGHILSTTGDAPRLCYNSERIRSE
jgi:hypothetical protein